MAIKHSTTTPRAVEATGDKLRIVRGSMSARNARAAAPAATAPQVPAASLRDLAIAVTFVDDTPGDRCFWKSIASTGD